MIKKVLGNIAQIYQSIAINGRDIISTLLLITGVLFITNLISVIGLHFGIDISETKDFVFALGKFAAVALCGVGYLCHVTFRHSLGEHDRNEFMSTWRLILTPRERLEWFFKVAIAGLIAAALVFSIGV